MKGMTIRIAAACALVLVLSLAVAAQKPASIAGKWELTGQGRQGPTTQTVTFEQDGEKLKGSIEAPAGGQGGGSAPLEGTIKANKVTFKVTRQGPDGQSRVVEYSATVEGDTMKGTRAMGERTSEFTAKKMK